MTSKTSYTLEEAQKKAEHFCAYQERCHKEVVQKLRNMNMIPDAIDVIMVSLIENNFLNETRFAKAFAQGKFNIKHWGKRRITSELKQKNISEFNIKEAINVINDDDYYATFDALALKKCDSIKEKNMYKKRKKLADYLLYRGWESPMVYEKITELIS